MTDEPELDRLFTRLSITNRRPAPDDHPAPEKLSAYLANELSPEEDDALQEHLAACTLCTGLLLDLQRLLDPPQEDRPREGVADFETAAEWRELKEKLGRTWSPPVVVPKRRFLPRVVGSPALAAVLALLLLGTSYRMIVLERARVRPTSVEVKTIEAQGSKKGASAAPMTFRLGKVAMFDTHSEHPYSSYRLSFIDKDGQTQAKVEAPEDENGMIGVLLPQGSLTPGDYHVKVLGLEGTTTHPVQEFNIRILH